MESKYATGTRWWFFKFTLRVVLYSCWLQSYHASLWVSTWFFKSALCCFFIHIRYRGIMILRELSLNDSSFLLCVWFCIHIGYRGTIILHELSLCTSLVHFGCGFVFTLVTGVPWFFASCLNMILQIRFVCGYVFTLVTGVSWFFASCLIMILQIGFVCGFVFTLVTGVSWFFASYTFVQWAFLHALSSCDYFGLSINLNFFFTGSQVYCLLRDLSLCIA